jgi:NAD-dependent DNA ligase
MISLDNTYNEDDLRDFDDRVKKNMSSSQSSPKEEREFIEYTLELKFD